jgi:methylated-DNA-protein-cysteine methyltransferase-like protein
MALLAAIPAGRVTTPEAIAAQLDVAPAWIRTAIGRLSDDELQMVPWHRVVAVGGAIGRGPWQETQFARLVREGITVSPAGIVQDMGRVQLGDLANLPRLSDGRAPSSLASSTIPDGVPPGASSRSRGMKDRPGG